jgi:hypothetical protein
MRPLEQLINNEDDGWRFVLEWKENAKNKVEILPIQNKQKAENELLGSQVTTRSPMGVIIYHSGGILVDGLGKVFYYAPDTQKWEKMKDFGYTQFINFCFSGDLAGYYKELRWKTWKDDSKKVSGNQAYYFYPFLFTVEGKDIERVDKNIVPVSEIWR